MLDARFPHSYFCQSLYTLQRGLPAIVGLLVDSDTEETISLVILISVYTDITECLKVTLNFSNTKRNNAKLIFYRADACVNLYIKIARFVCQTGSVSECRTAGMPIMSHCQPYADHLALRQHAAIFGRRHCTRSAFRPCPTACANV